MKTILLLSLLLLSCSSPEAPAEPPVDQRAFNDSLLKAVSDSLDRLPLPGNNIAAEMEFRAKYDNVNDSNLQK